MPAPVPLPGLMPASFRGVPFFIPNSRRASGRRQAEFELAASDITEREDLGLLNGPIDIEGVYVGDDYIAVEAALRAAFETPGPGTLQHPWYGPLLVELTAPGETNFDADSLRSFRFRATFKLFIQSSGALVSTLPALAAAASALLTVAGGTLQTALTLPFAQGAFRAAADLLSSAMRSGPGGAVLASLDSLPSLDTAVITADTAQSWLAAFGGAIGNAGVAPQTPAVAAGPAGRVTAPLVPARDATSALMMLAATLAADPNARAADRAIAIATSAAMLASAITPLSAIDYESRQEAMRWSGLMATAFDTAMQTTALNLALGPVEIGTLWRALSETKRRMIEDIDERIGRLPSVLMITPPGQVSAWLVAQYVAGDSPARLKSLVEDIHRRNGLRHPALAGPSVLEVLP